MLVKEIAPPCRKNSHFKRTNLTSASVKGSALSFACGVNVLSLLVRPHQPCDCTHQKHSAHVVRHTVAKDVPDQGSTKPSKGQAVDMDRIKKTGREES